MSILSVPIQDLWPILAILLWFLASRFILPRLGVRT